MNDSCVRDISNLPLRYGAWLRRRLISAALVEERPRSVEGRMLRKQVGGGGRFDDAMEQTLRRPDQKSANECRDLLSQTIGEITGAEPAADSLLFLLFFPVSFFSGSLTVKQTVCGEDVVEKQAPTATNKPADSQFFNRITLYAVNDQPQCRRRLSSSTRCAVGGDSERS